MHPIKKYSKKIGHAPEKIDHFKRLLNCESEDDEEYRWRRVFEILLKADRARIERLSAKTTGEISDEKTNPK